MTDSQVTRRFGDVLTSSQALPTSLMDAVRAKGIVGTDAELLELVRKGVGQAESAGLSLSELDGTNSRLDSSGPRLEVGNEASLKAGTYFTPAIEAAYWLYQAGKHQGWWE